MPLRFVQNASTFETKRKDVLGKTQGRLKANARTF